VNGERNGLSRREPSNGHAGTNVRKDRRGTPVTDARPARETAGPAGRKPVVVKLGGRALEAPGALREFASALARLSRVTLLVHGGGAEVTSWCERLGIEPRFHDGLRVTDEATLDVVTAVLAGLANKRLVAALRALDVDAVGLAALDGGCVLAAPHPDASALGAVGTIESVDPSLLEALLAQGRTPVLASIAADANGALLNLNADDAAAAIAIAVGASDLVLLSDTPGLKLGGAVVPALAAEDLAAALASAEVAGGMRPKLRAAGEALAHGVGRAHIAAWSGPNTLAALLERAHGGTTITGATPNPVTEDQHA
jgi:acetylglutamate kinase